MEYDIAKSVFDAIAKCDDYFNDILDSIEMISDVDERNHMRKAVADIVGRIYTDILIPIGADHPDLRL